MITMKECEKIAHELRELADVVSVVGRNLPQLPTVMQRLLKDKMQSIEALLCDNSVTNSDSTQLPESITVPINVTPPTPIISSTTPSIDTPSIVVATQSTNKKIDESKTTTVSPTFSIEEMMQRRLAKDIRKALSLNDKFLFRRELFGGNDQLMSDTLDKINNSENYMQAREFLCENFKWDEENSAVIQFLSIVEKRFA